MTAPIISTLAFNYNQDFLPSFFFFTFFFFFPTIEAAFLSAQHIQRQKNAAVETVPSFTGHRKEAKRYVENY